MNNDVSASAIAGTSHQRPSGNSGNPSLSAGGAPKKQRLEKPRCYDVVHAWRYCCVPAKPEDSVGAESLGLAFAVGSRSLARVPPPGPSRSPASSWPFFSSSNLAIRILHRMVSCARAKQKSPRMLWSARYRVTRASDSKTQRRKRGVHHNIRPALASISIACNPLWGCQGLIAPTKETIIESPCEAARSAGGEGGGGYSSVACLSNLAIDHASLSRRSGGGRWDFKAEGDTSNKNDEYKLGHTKQPFLLGRGGGGRTRSSALGATRYSTRAQHAGTILVLLPACSGWMMYKIAFLALLVDVTLTPRGCIYFLDVCDSQIPLGCREKEKKLKKANVIIPQGQPTHEQTRETKMVGKKAFF